MSAKNEHGIMRYSDYSSHTPHADHTFLLNSFLHPLGNTHFHGAANVWSVLQEGLHVVAQPRVLAGACRSSSDKRDTQATQWLTTTRTRLGQDSLDCRVMHRSFVCHYRRRLSVIDLLHGGVERRRHSHPRSSGVRASRRLWGTITSSSGGSSSTSRCCCAHERASASPRHRGASACCRCPC